MRREPKKVYIIFCDKREGFSDVYGIYSDKEAAKKLVDKLNASVGYDDDGYTLEERAVGFHLDSREMDSKEDYDLLELGE